MLSYQHAYHAGNLADVHKHGLLAWMLGYLIRKDKPLSYLESHAGAGLYRLDGPEATKTNEAAAGIARAEGWFAADHPYRAALDAVRAAHGPTAYPGSPLLAAQLLRPADPMRLAELHPQEFAALHSLLGRRAVVEQRDGLEMARAVCPPDPARGLLLIDPSWEVKSDYQTVPTLVARLHKRWPVGVIVLWYPLLDGAPHAPMLGALRSALPEAYRARGRLPGAGEGARPARLGPLRCQPAVRAGGRGGAPRRSVRRALTLFAGQPPPLYRALMFTDLLRRLAAPEAGRLPEPDARLALAALLVRVARSDGSYDAGEVARIDRIVATALCVDRRRRKGPAAGGRGARGRGARHRALYPRDQGRRAL